jgi:hypothetical protein
MEERTNLFARGAYEYVHGEGIAGVKLKLSPKWRSERTCSLAERTSTFTERAPGGSLRGDRGEVG